MATKSVVLGLIARGFDLSRAVPFERAAHVECSRCQAVAVNGAACHEHGCPNKPGMCGECGQPCERGAGYCSEHCANVALGDACYCADCMADAPVCLVAMRCLCAGHVRGDDATAPCDTREARRVRVESLVVGALVDWTGHATDGDMAAAEHELFKVVGVERETAGCVRVDFDGRDSYGVPAGTLVDVYDHE